MEQQDCKEVFCQERDIKMVDKPRGIIYERTSTNYIRFKNLTEYPSLADIKYIIQITFQHFQDTNNKERLKDLKEFVVDVLILNKIEEFKKEYINKK